MTGTEFYWTIVVAVGGACWAVIAAIRERRTQAIAQSHSLIERLIDGDTLIIEHPDIQQYLSNTAMEEEGFFRNTNVLIDKEFFRAKSYLYYKLNLFDEILSTAAQVKGSTFFIRPPAVIELINWEAYIMHLLSHPMCRSIMRNEGHIFGIALQAFWDKNKGRIESRMPDIFSW